MRRPKFALILLLVPVIGIGLGVLFLINSALAGTSYNGILTVSPYASGTDNLVSATGTHWVFSGTTTQTLIPGDIFRFSTPTTTVGSPFLITDPSTVASSGIVFYKAFPPIDTGVASATITSSSRAAFYGFVIATTSANTAFSVTLGGVTNNNVASTVYEWQAEAGALANPLQPFGAMLTTKFLATTTERLIATSGSSGISAITSLTLADNDITSYGLDGRDFYMTWNPGTSTPTGMEYAQIYILPSGTNLTTTNLLTACGGNPTSPVGYYNSGMYLTFTMHTPPMYMKTDSCNTNFATSSSYVAWIYVKATASFVASSSAVSYANAFDSVTDMMAPFIEHMSVNTAKSAATATIYAIINDDQTSAAEFAAGTNGAYFQIIYGADVSTASSAANGTVVSGNLYKFTIAKSFIDANSTSFEYYIKANDKAGNKRHFCAMPPDSATDSACQAQPFVVNVVASLPRSISGTVLSSGSNVANAYVFAGGVAIAAATTSGSGAYIITSLPENSMINLTAHKVGYCQMMRTENIGTVDKTDVLININQGECGGYMGGGGGGGTGGSPTVIFSGPPDGMQNVPLTEKMRVGFSQPLDTTTVNDSSADSTSDNIYLINNLTNTIATGTVTYCPNSSSSGCSALFSMDNNVVLFEPAASLATSTGYALVITEKVKSQGGQSVQGNRPSGGHRINFTTVGGVFDMGTIGGSYGNSGQYMPPFVRSVNPAPGMTAAGNVKITIEFNQAMKSDTITTTNIKLKNVTSNSYVTLSSVSLDSTESRFVKLTPQADLTNGSEYQVEVYGAIANAQGITMRDVAGATERAFSSNFRVSSASDSTAPTLYAALAASSINVPVNQVFEFGASEQLDFSTVNTTNVTMYRGATAATVNVSYDPGKNSVFVAPISALAPSTAYSIIIGYGVKDLAGNSVATTTYSYTTGSGDTTAPGLREARCDDYKCRMVFTEPMNHDTQADTNWANSVINPANWTIERTAPSAAVISITGKPMNYNSVDYSVTVEGIAGLAASDTYRVTASTNIKDLSENALSDSTKTFTGIAESSAQTFGQFGDAGMFGPPTGTFVTGGVGGGEFVPQGFGNYTAEQFAFGSADMAYPFNPMLGQDVNVFQVRFKPGVALSDGDKIAITFPSGTNASSTAFDTRSPFYIDFNQDSNTVVTGTALTVNNTERKVTITLGISGTASINDVYTIDLAKIINPVIPKGPDTGGYTVTLQAISGSTVLASKTSMPYFIEAGGTNTITIGVYAASSTAPTNGANGTVYLHGGGPSGPMEKVLTLTNGAISAVDGTATTTLVYRNLRDGCYCVGTEPFMSLGGNDYFGQMSPEQICVNGGQSSSKNIVLTSAATGNSIPVIVKLVDGDGNPYNFGGKDIDIFAGGPGTFVVKSLTGVNAAATAGYQIKLSANGHWNIGVGPAMSKGPSTGMPTSLGVMPPPPIDLVVSNIGTVASSVAAGMFAPPGMSFSSTGNTLTVTLATANKTVTGTVKDTAGNGLANINVFLNRQGFGSPIFGQTNASGTFSLAVSDYGTYEIGASMPGMPPVFKMVDIRSDGNYVDGKKITGGNPFVIVMNKAAYTISGKVLDASNNAISGAPLMATDANGNSVFNMSGSDGSYTLFVGNGTWIINVQMPPDKNDSCGSFSKTVTIASASQSSQNITPTAGTCYTLSGTVSVGGTTLNNVPLFVEEWNAVNSTPVMGGLKKPASTASNGAYSVKVLGNKTYHIGTWHPDYGELSATKAVASADATQNISVTADTVTFNFTGGLSTMNAMIELKNSTNKNEVIRKQVSGLASSAVINIQNAATYNYFVDVFGYGKYSGTVTSTGGADAVTIDVSGTDYVTVSGIIKDASGNALSGASVNIVGTTTNLTVNDLTDSTGAYSIKIKAGSYQMSSNLNGYVSPAPANVVFSTTTANYDFATGQDQSPLATSSCTIEGVASSSAAVVMTEGYVWATNAAGTVVSAPIEADGSYSLPVTAGAWTVKAVGPLHDETTKSGTVTVTTADQTGVNFVLDSDATRIPTSTTGIVGASTGGSINDSNSSGMKLTVGSGVLETGSGNVTVNMEKGYNAPDSSVYQALDNATFSIAATGDSSIKTLNGNAEIQIDYSSLLATLPAGVSESNLQLMYYSPERGDYVPVEGGYTVDATNNTVTGLVNHFTDFVLAYVPPIEGVPTAPTGVTATAVSSSQINISWTAVSGATLYNVHRSSSAGGTYSDVASTAATSYSDTSLSAGTTYYYKITASSTVGEGASSDYAVATTQSASSGGGSGNFSITYCSSVVYDNWQANCSSNWQWRNVLSQTPSGCTLTSAQENDKKRACGQVIATTTLPEIISEVKESVGTTSSITKEFAQKVIDIAAEAAEIVKVDINGLLGKLGFKRDLAKEDVSLKKYVKSLIKNEKGITSDDQNEINRFIAYGTPTTQKLGAGERAGVVNSYKSAFGKLPKTEAEWNDAIKIANGRWPSVKSAATEANSVVVFKKIYLRNPDRKNPKDDAAVMVIAYGLRPTGRNLNSEKAAIKSFVAIYGYYPKSASAWDVVRAIAYSGAKR